MWLPRFFFSFSHLPCHFLHTFSPLPLAFQSSQPPPPAALSISITSFRSEPVFSCAHTTRAPPVSPRSHAWQDAQATVALALICLS